MKIKREVNGQTFEFELTDEEIGEVFRESDRADVMDFIRGTMPRLAEWDDAIIRRVRSHVEEVIDRYQEKRIDAYYTSGSWTEDIEDAIRDMLEEGKI